MNLAEKLISAHLVDGEMKPGAEAVRGGDVIRVHNLDREQTVDARHRLSPRQIEMVLAGGRIAQFRNDPTTEVSNHAVPSS